jgi:rare lipoprotein A
MHKMPIHRGVKTLLIVLLITASSSLFAETAATPGTELQGLASWYGGKFHGRLTSSGEIFDTNDMTAAHKTLPFGTIVKVTNEDNGKTAIVKITDRGPFVEGRIIDLSRAAAMQLDMVGTGVARVSLQIVDFTTDKDLYAIQVGAYALEGNAVRASVTLQAAGFMVTTEKTALGVARVFIRGIAAGDLAQSRKKIEGLGFTTYLVKKEKTESSARAGRTDVALPILAVRSP